MADIYESGSEPLIWARIEGDSDLSGLSVEMCVSPTAVPTAWLSLSDIEHPTPNVIRAALKVQATTPGTFFVFVKVTGADEVLILRAGIFKVR